MSNNLTTLVRFDYEALDSETRIVVQQKTSEIRSIAKRMTHEIHEIGQRLIEVKSRLKHGLWLDWLSSEFEWSDDTAERYMGVARSFAQIPHGADFHARALYLLASPSTPIEAREEAIEVAASGETVTHSRAKEIVASHSPKPIAPSKPEPERRSAEKSQALQPGQKVQVVDERSPHYGQTVEVQTIESVVVSATNEAGEEITLLTDEITPDRPITPVAPKAAKPNHYESLESQLLIAKQRITYLESLLRTGLRLFEEYEVDETEQRWIDEVGEAIG